MVLDEEFCALISAEEVRIRHFRWPDTSTSRWLCNAKPSAKFAPSCQLVSTSQTKINLEKETIGSRLNTLRWKEKETARTSPFGRGANYSKWVTTHALCLDVMVIPVQATLG